MVLKNIIIYFISLTFISMAYANIDISVLLDNLEKGVEIRKGMKSINDYFKLKNINHNHLEEDFVIDQMTQILLYFDLLYFLKNIEAKTLTFTNKNIKRYKKIITLSEEFDLDEQYDFDKLSNQFDKFYKQWTRSIFNKYYYLDLHYIIWNYSLKLKDSTGEENQLQSKEKGWCLGAGIKIENFNWGGGANLCLAYMMATVSEDSEKIKYNQYHVPVEAAILTPNIFWRPRERVALKFSIPLVYHQGHYNSPAGGEIKDENKYSYGYLIGGEWDFNSHFHFDINFGKLYKYPSSVWEIGLGYTF